MSYVQRHRAPKKLSWLNRRWLGMLARISRHAQYIALWAEHKASSHHCQLERVIGADKWPSSHDHQAASDPQNHAANPTADTPTTGFQAADQNPSPPDAMPQPSLSAKHSNGQAHTGDPA